jgi:hypothetical protein
LTSKSIENHEFPFLMAIGNIANLDLDFKTRWKYANAGKTS